MREEVIAVDARTPAELLSRTPPRDIELNWNGRLLLTMAVVFSLFFTGFGLWQIKVLRLEHQRFEALTQRGSLETAHVTGTSTERQGKSTIYLVGYQFSVNGVTYQGQSKVDQNHFFGHTVGETLPVQYLTENPSVSRLLIERPPVAYWIVLVYFLFPFIFALTIVMPLNLQKEVLTNGVPAQGLVLGTTRTRNGVSVRYEFMADNGLSVRSKALISSKEKPNVGDNVTILYLREQPKKSIVYPPALVRLRT